MNNRTRNITLLLVIGLIVLMAVFALARGGDQENHQIPETDSGVGGIGSSPSDTTTVSVYHYDATRDTENGNVMCSERGLVSVPHTIEATDAPLRAVLDILLAGEQARPGLTPFPQGVTLERVAVSDGGVATITLDDPGNRTSGGACQASILRAQLERTVLQFPHIKSVRIEPEELFQP